MPTLPLVDTNIFTRLHYLELLLKLERQEKLQLMNGTEDAYPTWQIEKKILYWSYLGHKHLFHPIKSETALVLGSPFARFEQWLIKHDELQSLHIKREWVFMNLVERGFARHVPNDKEYQCVLTKEGHAVGAILWDATKFKITDKGVYILTVKCRYKIAYKLLLLSVYILYTLIGSVVVLEALNLMGLLDEAKNLFSFLPNTIWSIVVFLLLMNVITFFVSLLLSSELFIRQKQKVQRYTLLRNKFNPLPDNN
ncbi:MAG: hypothetical protein WCW27_01280 [Patescibacteria group bacterium]|jgi:hypothetical protein